VDVRDANNRTIAGVPATWNSLNPAVATVDRLTGLVTAIAIGNTTVTVAAGGVSGEAQIIVTPPPVVFTEISARKGHVCGISRDAQVYCWGLNADWQLGDGTFETRFQPTPVGKTPFAVRSVGAGYRHTCAIAQTGARWCWGSNKGAELGIGSTTGSSTPVNSAQESIAFVSVRSGQSYTCGVEAQTGAGYCWGENTLATLGDGTTTRRGTPTRVGGNVRFSTIEPAAIHTCALEAATELAYCWGSNAFGELGIPASDDPQPAPQAVANGKRFTSITLGFHHTCAIESGSGIAYCWGSNADGALGDGTTTNRAAPTPVSGGRRFASISAGFTHTCGVEAQTGVAFCWGRNDSGGLGDGTRSDHLTPTPVASTDRFAMIVAGWNFTCALQAVTGHAYCWGTNTVGELGTGSAALAILVPAPVASPNK
jgi:alpha-tubulin suppressor-like RCC1 family protein